jgi:hypothetical protein
MEEAGSSETPVLSTGLYGVTPVKIVIFMVMKIQVE